MRAAIQLGTQGKRPLIGSGTRRIWLQPTQLWRAAVVVVDGNLIKGTSAIVGGCNANAIGTWYEVDAALQQAVIFIEIEPIHRHTIVQNLNLVGIEMSAEGSIECVCRLLNIRNICIHDLNRRQLTSDLFYLNRLRLAATLRSGG